MTSSLKSTLGSSAVGSLNLNDRAALAKLFWTSRIMNTFATGQHRARVLHIPPPDRAKISDMFFGEGSLTIDMAKLPAIEFVLRPVYIGRETWVAVTCNGMVIVPPFPFTSYADLPLYPEDIPDV